MARSSGPGRWPGRGGSGCMVVAAGLGLALGLNAGGGALPPELKVAFGVAFGLFFGILAWVFTGMGARREQGLETELILAVPARAASSLRQAVVAANPPKSLSPAEVGRLDAVVAELDELAALLKRSPRSGTRPEVRQRLEQIAAEWLDQAEVDAWLAGLQAAPEDRG